MVGIWIAIAAGVSLVAGLVMLCRSLRARRLDDHPTCRKCRFDLHGVYPEMTICPECGVDVAQKRAIRVGNRRVSWARFGGASAVVLLSLGVIGFVAADRISPALMQSIKPAWLLETESTSGNTKIATLAIEELTTRIADGVLSDERTVRLVDRALDHQGDLLANWIPNWAELIESAWAAEVIGTDRYGRYKRQAIRVFSGVEILPFEIGPGVVALSADVSRASRTVPYRFEADIVRADIDGEPIKIADGSMRGQVTGGGTLTMTKDVGLTYDGTMNPNSLAESDTAGTLTVVWRIWIPHRADPLATFEKTLTYTLPPP